MDKRFERENQKMEERKKQCISFNNNNKKKNISLSSSSSSSPSSSVLVFDDLNVAHILLQLPYIIAEYESRHQISFNWAVKRKRSALNSTPSPSPSPLHHPPPNLIIHDAKPDIITTTTTTSPTTPLSFSPTSDSYDKLKLSSKKTSTSTTITTATITEVENRKLKALNSELKVNPYMEIHDMENQKVFIDQTVRKTETCLKNEEDRCGQFIHHQCSSYSNGDFGMVNKKVNIKGPTGIPDLNVCAEDDSSMEFIHHIQQLDFRRALINKAMAAEARKKRRQIYKGKNKTHK